MKKNIPAILLFFIITGSFFSTYGQPLKKPDNVVIVVVNGLGFNNLNALSGQEKKSLFWNFDHTGILMPHPGKPEYLPVLSYFTTGVYNDKKWLGMDKEGNKQDHWFDFARKSGKSTALISPNSIFDYKVSSFFAHSNDPMNREDVLEDLLDARVDVVISGGLDQLNSRKTDSLFFKFSQWDYEMVSKFKKLKRSKTGKLIGIFPDKEVIEALNKEDYFEEAWDETYKTFARQNKPYFVVIEHSMIGFASGKNEDVKKDLLSLDKLINQINMMTSGQGNTLLLVVSAYEESAIIPGGRGNSINTGNPVPVFAKGSGASSFSGMFTMETLFEKVKEIVE